MRVLLLGGTWFLGRRIAERLHERGDTVLVVHRGHNEPMDGPPVRHLHTPRLSLLEHATTVREFAPQQIVDTCAFTAADVDAVLPALPEVPTVVLSSQDVYRAHTGLVTGQALAPLPITEDSPLRTERYPYRNAGYAHVPADYDKLDVEERWRSRHATVLRLPLVYGPHDWQRREDILLRRIRAGRIRIPVGAANLLWTRCHVDDVATGVLAALDNDAAIGQTFNLGETHTWPLWTWLEQILEAANSAAELVRVPDAALPPDLALSAAPAQHLLVSVTRAQQMLGWDPADPSIQVERSVRWHLNHPPAEPTWSDNDVARDDAALATAS